ncbi:TIGR01906 family membrane protein [Anaerocolumna xylanovorans]|uniref:Integral membrane protein TIGR01906 n=1 Tax=Anaerocolumna xylanovorans DSM 12503 TaxID=1121345 RepID=A0A1M7YHP9_9FIRM|nr:TIGR01906 family membrane protein [Anaerocolumna xylanovorans]SHO52089.1 integral membrane protein TIGR01906 [Anaerocolumna xylanovorans DSM 12503]
MKKFKFTDIGIGLLFALFFLSAGVILAVNFRPLYYFDIKNLDIAKTSGIEASVIKENYDALIDYNSPFFKGELEFPTLPSSAPALEHFKEVKSLFLSFYFICGVIAVLLLIIILYKKKIKDYSYLVPSAVTVLVLPLLVALACAVNFDKLFIVFHKIFFRNDYWLFDPATDPIINLLPDTYFMHCLLLIIAIILLGSFCLFFVSHIIRKSNDKFRSNT